MCASVHECVCGLCRAQYFVKTHKEDKLSYPFISPPKKKKTSFALAIFFWLFFFYPLSFFFFLLMSAAVLLSSPVLQGRSLL